MEGCPAFIIEKEGEPTVFAFRDLTGGAERVCFHQNSHLCFYIMITEKRDVGQMLSNGLSIKKYLESLKKKKEAEENKINGLLSWSPLGRYLIWWGQWLFRIFLICAFLHFVKE